MKNSATKKMNKEWKQQSKNMHIFVVQTQLLGFLNNEQQSYCSFLQCSDYNIMEEEKKKFLLSRIKREQALIASQFQKYKKIYHGREMSLEKSESYLQHISHTVQINNSLASNLYEYLDKVQMQGVFTRINTIFCDLIDKYRKSNHHLSFFQSKRNVKQIRQICDVCHEKIETNRIENIRRGLDEESECRAAVIKKMIDESELERTTPVFSEDQDKQFKRELEKVFKNKELVLQTNIHQSNVFLATVQEEIAGFMVSFRKDFAQWGGHQIEEQNENWGKMMKGYINKKLTNSFNNKIPNWIKKMHELFMDKQPTKPKLYFMNKECQVSIPTQVEEKMSQQMEDLNHSLIMKREALKNKEQELEYEKIRSKALKAELESLQQYYVEKLYAKDQSTKENIAQFEEMFANQNIRTSVVNLKDNSDGQNYQLNDRQMESRSNKNKKKFAKLTYKMMLQKSPKEIKQLNSNQDLQLSRNLPSNHIDSKSEKANNHLLMRKQSSPLLSSFEGSNSYIDQGNLRLKRKAYNRQKRDEMLSDHEKQKKNQSVSYLEDKQRQKSELKDEVKSICNEISKDLRFKKNTKSNNSRRFNSISITEDAPLPQAQTHDQIKNSPSAVILPTHSSAHKMANFSDISKREDDKNAPIREQIDNQEMNQVINNLVELSKCEQLVTQHDKVRLNKIIQNFFGNLERRNSKSIIVQPLKMSKVVFSANKQNHIPKSIFKEPEYGPLSKSLKKEQRRQFETLERKNKSLHTHVLKLPAISIKNYIHEVEDSSNSKDNFALFIDETCAQQFEQSFESSKEKHTAKPTPSQLQGIEQLFSELQLLKRRNSSDYIQLCSYLRFPFSSTRQRSSLIALTSGFNFSTFCNYFLKILWLHRDCAVQEGKPFCPHINKFQKKMLTIPETKTNRIKRSEHEQING